MRTNKAQGTIEYLVIIAIVIVIALVVVGLLLQIMGQNTGAIETSSKTAWCSAQPWAIKDWSRATDGKLTIVLQNNSAYSLNFIGMNLSTTTNDTNTTYKEGIMPSATLLIIIPTQTDCPTGTKYIYPKTTILIDYNNINLPAKRQYANSDIMGTC